MRRYALVRSHPRALAPVMAAYRLGMERHELRAALEATWISSLVSLQRQRTLYRVQNVRAAASAAARLAENPPETRRKRRKVQES